MWHQILPRRMNGLSLRHHCVFTWRSKPPTVCQQPAVLGWTRPWRRWQSTAIKEEHKGKSNRYRRYSKSEDEQISELRRQGLSYLAIATKLGRTASAIEYRIGHYIKPSGLKRHYGPLPAADQLRVAHLRSAGKTWKEICQALPRRSLYALQRDWYARRGLASEAHDYVSSSGLLWSAAETAKLFQLRGVDGLAWWFVQQHFPNRSRRSLESKYRLLREQPADKRRFTAADDKVLSDLRRTGTPYAAIQAHLPSRTIHSLKSRYKNTLLPSGLRYRPPPSDNSGAPTKPQKGEGSPKANPH